MLEALLTHYGCPILVIGTLLEGETIMVLGGLAAHLGYLSFEGVLVCGVCGTVLGDQLYFFIGRRQRIQNGSPQLAFGVLLLESRPPCVHDELEAAGVRTHCLITPGT